MTREARRGLITGFCLLALACAGSGETKQPQASTTQTGGEPDSCAAPEGSWYLHISDIHLGATVETQQPGGDTSVPLWNATKAELIEHLSGPNPPAFILFTGDLPDHSPDRGDEHTANIQTVLADLKSIAGSIPLLFMPGNNDSLDWDYATFTSTAGQTPLSVSNWAGPTVNVAAHGDPEQGYYAAVPVAGLRVIALNTVIFSASYPCSHQAPTPGNCKSEQDGEADRQLAWVKTELEAAAKAGEKVMLAMHIPPGVDAYQSPTLMWKEQQWQDQLLALIAASASEVVGLAFGHTHFDELRRLYNDAGELEIIALSAPGITPGHGNNPGFKAVAYDANFRPTDVLTWYATASDPNAPVYGYAPDGCYHYREVFGCEGQDLRACLGTPEVCTLAETMDTIYTVKNGAPTYSIATGIDVRVGTATPPTCAAQSG
jgi:sphingomyelin phosphodiesterase acid-like 3